jgi:hypothetical protein
MGKTPVRIISESMPQESLPLRIRGETVARKSSGVVLYDLFGIEFG